MKCIIAGGRDRIDPQLVVDAVAACPFAADITCVVSGGAQGIDTLGAEWARANDIPVIEIHADWEKFGRSAGPRRNGEMARIGDALIAIPGAGTGTFNMIKQAQARGLRVFIYRP